jgi:hypothetical protein
MYNIDTKEITQEFAECWSSAGHYIQSQAQDIELNWLKAELELPFLEHLSFRIGNQLFFVRLEDIENRIRGPGIVDGYKHIAKECKGHACLMLMHKSDGQWLPVNTGWG